MKSLGARASGLRLERMQASPLWVPQEQGGGFRNLAPIRPGLRDPNVKMPSLADFRCGGTRRVPDVMVLIPTIPKITRHANDRNGSSCRTELRGSIASS